MGRELTVDGARRVRDEIILFETTRPCQHNRGHFRNVLSTGLEVGAINSRELRQFGLDNGDLQGIFIGKAIRGISDSSRAAILSTMHMRADNKLGFRQQ